MSLKEPTKMELGDGVIIDYVPGDEYIQVSIDKEHKRIKYAELWAAVFAMATPEQQEQIMPVRQTEMMVYERVHKVKVTKDLHKGDVLKFRCHVDVPMTITESLTGLLQKEKGKSGLILT